MREALELLFLFKKLTEKKRSYLIITIYNLQYDESDARSDESDAS